MPDRITTSFIPKNSLDPKKSRGGSVSQTTVGVVNAVAIVILILSLIGAGVAFFYEQYLLTSIESKKESLERARDAFQVATIKELSRLDRRLSVGTDLLRAHIAPSIIFDYIEEHTLQSVRFTSFSLSEINENSMLVSMRGEALSFNAIALQSSLFGNNDLFSEVIFSNLNIDSNGNVVFEFSGSVNKEFIRYTPRASAGAPLPADLGEATP